MDHEQAYRSGVNIRLKRPGFLLFSKTNQNESNNLMNDRT